MNKMAKSIADYLEFSNITLFYLSILILLSAITSYVRVEAFHRLLPENPALTFNDVIIPSLQLVPAEFFFNPWTLWTSTFVETSPLQFVSALVIIYFGVNYLESQWNPLSAVNKPQISETITFLTITTVLTNLSSVLIIDLKNMLISSDAKTLNLPLSHGIFTTILPFVVVLKQLTPETNIKIFQLLKFRVKRLPFILICLSIFISVVFKSLFPFIPAFNSFLISWIYLRYSQYIMVTDILPQSEVPTSSIVRGDASDTFAFIEFFPDVLKDFARPVCDGFYQFAVFLALVRGFNDDDVDASNLRTIKRLNGNSGGNQSNSFSDGNAADSDRRRQVALKVLEQTIDRKD